MSISQAQDLRLRFGNLFLAAIVSVVPTLMTISFLGVHGYILCKNLDNRLEAVNKLPVKELCAESNLEANYKYLIWIWMFITIPTWRWFYIGHYKRVKQHKANSD